MTFQTPINKKLNYFCIIIFYQYDLTNQIYKSIIMYYLEENGEFCIVNGEFCIVGLGVCEVEKVNGLTGSKFG